MTKKIFPIKSVPQSKTAGLYSFLTVVEGAGAGLRFRSQPDALDPPAKCFVPVLDSLKIQRDVLLVPLYGFESLLDSFKSLRGVLLSMLVLFKIGLHEGSFWQFS